MVAFGNPVRGIIHPLGWVRPAGNVDFACIRRFGDTSVKIGTTYPPHNGVDLGNGRSGDPVLAVDPGRVVYAAADPASGGALIVIVDHGNSYRSWYAHLGRINVGVGQTVARGTQVGTHDTTGWAYGAHLHFQVDQLISGVRRNVDPWPLLAQNQAAPTQYAVITSAGVYVRTQPAVDPTDEYRQSTATYLINLKMRFGGFVAGGTYRYGSTGQYLGSSWARVYLNSGWRYVAKPFVKLL